MSDSLGSIGFSRPSRDTCQGCGRTGAGQDRLAPDLPSPPHSNGPSDDQGLRTAKAKFEEVRGMALGKCHPQKHHVGWRGHISIAIRMEPGRKFPRPSLYASPPTSPINEKANSGRWSLGCGTWLHTRRESAVTGFKGGRGRPDVARDPSTVQ